MHKSVKIRCGAKR